ncbi:MAG: YvcK family protein [Acidobacteria bacterium]|nr:YvcK family protein [Acidobacteriota bacterium]MBI3280593.1 YvcK family protein [Acidobacteriota bacterium]
MRIVAIGGGTGLSVLLQGLKRRMFAANASAPTAIDLTAVVTVTDDGGSSGRLRREFDVLPPGDIRNCMVAMSEDEALFSRLFQYRFEAGRGLKGHSFGNLFLTALTNLTGDFAHAVQLSSEVLAICGRIFPSTGANVGLEAELEDGHVVSGETKISKSTSRIRSVRLRPENCRPMPEALEAIAAADLISFGPGSLFTSVLPNLLVNGIPEAIQASPAVKAYYVNLMWQPGETIGFTASDHLRAIFDHAGLPVVDYAIVNTRPITASAKRRYAREKAKPVEVDMERLLALGVRVQGVELATEFGTVRHDPAAAAETAIRLAEEGRRKRAERRATA